MTPASNPSGPTTYPDAVVAGARAADAEMAKWDVRRVPNSYDYAVVPVSESFLWAAVPKGTFNAMSELRMTRAFAAGLEAMQDNQLKALRHKQEVHDGGGSCDCATCLPQPRTTVEDDVLHVDLPADKYDVTPTGGWKKKPRTTGDAA